MRLTAALLFLLSVLVPPAFAASGPWSDSDQASVRLVSAVDGTGNAEKLLLGLEFQLQPGWKVYWRSPGDAGFPPRPDWAGSDNLADVAMQWPAPHRFSILGLESFGYEDRVVFPLEVTPATVGAPLSMRASVDYLVCSDICVPGLADVSIDIPAGAASPSRFFRDISTFRSRVPPPPEGSPLRINNSALQPSGDDMVELQVALASTDGLTAPDIFVEGPDGVFFGPPRALENRDGARVFSLTGGGADYAALANRDLTVTVVDGDAALEAVIRPQQGALSTGGGGLSLTGLVPILLLAVLGGLILNLMPCVLPVLSLKLLSVVGHGGGQSRAVRLGFLASAAGILTSFLILAGALIAVKMAGGAVGWGLQFQQPVFLAFITAIVVLFAGNLFGLFEITLPQPVAALALRSSEAGGDGSTGHGSSMTGHFLTGAFAALLATPCSAPFLGTAVGFALSRGPVEIVAVFAALGLGLSIPYLLVAALPRLATALPRPGAWMVKLRFVLGLGLAATAVWLLTVLQTAAGTEIMVAVAALSILAVAALAVRRLPGSRLGRRGGLVATGLVVAALAVPVVKPVAPMLEKPAAVDEASWEPFDLAALRGHVEAGRIVFVDVTADWCITCKFNKAAVMDAADFRALAEKPDFVTMRADWTRPDPAISEYLASFGRYGIPFNAVYGPGAENGIALPELLSMTDITAALATADTANRLALQ